MNTLSDLDHPGTTTGFADVLCSNMEKYVNVLIDDLHLTEGPVNKQKTSLAQKIGLLRGNEVKVFFERFGSAVYTRIEPVISSDLFVYLEETRQKRNAHAHAHVSVYTFLERFQSLCLDLDDRKWCVFIPSGNNLQVDEGKAYGGCTGGLRFFKSDIMQAPLLIVGDNIHYDLKMTLFTKSKSPISVKTTHVILLWWGKHQFVFPVDQYSLNAIKGYLSFDPKNKETCYFKLKPTETLIRIVQNQYQ